MTDLISRADAMGAVQDHFNDNGFKGYDDGQKMMDRIKALPSADAVPQLKQTDTLIIADALRYFAKDTERHLTDRTRADALRQQFLKYGASMCHSAEAVQGWIPCSERLPKAEDMYQPPEQRYLCQLEVYGEKKFCVLSRLKGAVSPFWDWYGVAVHDSEVIAWMPLPTPYKGGDEE